MRTFSIDEINALNDEHGIAYLDSSIPYNVADVLELSYPLSFRLSVIFRPENVTDQFMLDFVAWTGVQGLDLSAPRNAARCAAIDYIIAQYKDEKDYSLKIGKKLLAEADVVVKLRDMFAAGTGVL